MSRRPVLLVCSDEMTLNEVASLLRERGYEVVLARSRAEAIAALPLGAPDPADTTSRTPRAPAERGPEAEARQPEAIHLKEIVAAAARRTERDEIVKMLEQTRWNRVKAARLLNISYRALLYKMKSAGLGRPAPPIDCPT